GVFRRQDDLASLGKSGDIVEFNHVRPGTMTATREIGCCDDHRFTVRRYIDSGRETRVDLAHPPVTVAIKQVDARIDLVVERVIEHVYPMWRLRAGRGHGELLGGQGWRRRAGGSGGWRKSLGARQERQQNDS